MGAKHYIDPSFLHSGCFPATLALLIGNLWVTATAWPADDSYCLQLIDGSFGTGKIVACLPENLFAWQNEGFESPFILPWDSVLWITANAHQAQAAESDRQLLKELRSVRWNKTDDQLSWEQAADGRLTSVASGAIDAGLDFPDRFAVRLRLQLRNLNSFVLTLRSDRGQSRTARGGGQLLDARQWQRRSTSPNGLMALEAWSGKLFFVCQRGNQTDMVSLGSLLGNQSLLDITFWIDQTAERAAVQILGEPLRQLKFNGNLKDHNFGQLLVESAGGGLKLQDLQLWSWDGKLPDRWLPDKTQQPKLETKAAGQMHIVLSDGSHFQGHFLPSTFPLLSFRAIGADDYLELEHDRLREVIRIPMEDGSAMEPAERPRLDIQPPMIGEGILVTERGYLRGVLPESSQSLKDDFTVQWQPIASQIPGSLLPGFDGEIQFSSSPDVEAESGPRTALNSSRQEIVLRSGDRVFIEIDRIDHLGAHFYSENSAFSFAPHGDIHRFIFQSDRSRHDRLTEEKTERLYTMPKSLQQRPPTHLLVSGTGDYLRGYLSGLSQRVVNFETRGTPAAIPLERIAEIIWLEQPDDLPSDKIAIQGSNTDQSALPQIETAAIVDREATVDRAAAVPAEPARIRAILIDGQRLTFTSIGRADDRLIGFSPLWGEITLPLVEIERLEFGKDNTESGPVFTKPRPVRREFAPAEP